MIQPILNAETVCCRLHMVELAATTNRDIMNVPAIPLAGRHSTAGSSWQFG